VNRTYREHWQRIDLVKVTPLQTWPPDSRNSDLWNIGRWLTPA